MTSINRPVVQNLASTKVIALFHISSFANHWFMCFKFCGFIVDLPSWFWIKNKILSNKSLVLVSWKGSAKTAAKIFAWLLIWAFLCLLITFALLKYPNKTNVLINVFSLCFIYSNILQISDKTLSKTLTSLLWKSCPKMQMW